MKKSLLFLFLLSFINLQAQTTLCYKENLSTPAVSEDTPLDGGKCEGNKSVIDMQNEGWEVNDIKISQTNTGMNFTYVFKKGGVSSDTTSMSEDELIAKITERMLQQKKAEKKKQLEEQRIIASERIKTFYSEKCSSCHGQKGEIEAHNASRKLNEMSLVQLQKSIDGYKLGTYDRNGKSIIMMPYASLINHSDLNDLFLYFQSLNSNGEK